MQPARQVFEGVQESGRRVLQHLADYEYLVLTDGPQPLPAGERLQVRERIAHVSDCQDDIRVVEDHLLETVSRVEIGNRSGDGIHTGMAQHVVFEGSFAGSQQRFEPCYVKGPEALRLL